MLCRRPRLVPMDQWALGLAHVLQERGLLRHSTSSSQTWVSCSTLAWKRDGRISCNKGHGICASYRTQRLTVRLEMPNAIATWVLPTVTIERLADAREKGDLLLVPF